MSSEPETIPQLQSEPAPKKRRLRGACDICRRQKGACDREQMPNKVCSNCLAFNSECMHTMHPKDRKPRRNIHQTASKEIGTVLAESSKGPHHLAKAYVDAILSETTSYQAPLERDALIRILVHVSRYARKLELDLKASPGSEPPDRGDTVELELDREDNDYVYDDLHKLPELLRGLVLDAKHGRTTRENAMLLIKDALSPPPEESNAHTLIQPTAFSAKYNFWRAYPEPPPDPSTPHYFPPPNLIVHLVEIYFTQVHIHALVLHRPTFERELAAGAHLRNHQFGAVVLAVCALASRYSLDPRIFPPGTKDGELSAGAAWFQQIRRPFCGPFLRSMSLYELQLCCLFLLCESRNPIHTWLTSEIGLLHEQEIGSARRKNPTLAPNAEDELHKRCFCFLYVFDALMSAALGRPRLVISFSEYDLPVVCDDEYWEGPDSFKQPPGAPSLAAYHVALINLTRILTLAWRPKDSIANFRAQKSFDRPTISEINSRLNQWTEAIPEHLLWNPFMEDDIFFDQSATLYATYYMIVIVVHRPTLTSANRTLSAATAKSLEICTSAARACSHIADVKCRRGTLPHEYLLKAALDSAITLLLNISAFKRAGLPIDPGKELLDVYKCMALIRQASRRSYKAGIYYETLCDLMAAGNFALPPSSGDEAWDLWLSGPKRRVNQGTVATPAPDAWLQDSYSSLPVGAEDLGRLPMCGSSHNGFLLYETPPLHVPATFPAPNPNTESIAGNPIASIVPSFEETNVVEYMSDWAAYFYSVDETAMAQAMQNASAPV
ncbi:fungal-specific transcription factor domain-containing protein [Mycena rebaudengoi]|nr:fungal-specific transcription factor domain-containing protein [Mycena rebaudengoi]